jgi:hypothetical protein
MVKVTLVELIGTYMRHIPQSMRADLENQFEEKGSKFNKKGKRGMNKVKKIGILYFNQKWRVLCGEKHDWKEFFVGETPIEQKIHLVSNFCSKSFLFCNELFFTRKICLGGDLVRKEMS